MARVRYPDVELSSSRGDSPLFRKAGKGDGPHQTPSVARSTPTPGPIVEDTDTRCRNTPFEVEGLCFWMSAISASRFSFSAAGVKLALPIVQWTIPALSQR